MNERLFTQNRGSSPQIASLNSGLKTDFAFFQLAGRSDAKRQGEFDVANLLAINYALTMSQMLEQRVEQLEKRVAQLSEGVVPSNRKKDWRRTIGIFQNDPDFEEAVRLGREYREQQTYEKEIAGS